MKRLIRFPLCWLLPLLPGLSLMAGFRMHRQDAPGTRAPFTPFVVHQQTLFFPKQQDVPPKLGGRVFAIKADGSMALRLYEPDGWSQGLTAVLDLSNRHVLDIDHDTRSVSTYQVTAHTVDSWVYLHPGCAALEKRSQEMPGAPRRVLGITVKGLRERDRIGTFERLVAPELDCFSLREVYFASNGARNETSTVSVQIGEPDEALFGVPSGYVERSPVEVQALYERKHAGRQRLPPKVLEATQARYQRLRKQR